MSRHTRTPLIVTILAALILLLILLINSNQSPRTHQHTLQSLHNNIHQALHTFNPQQHNLADPQYKQTLIHTHTQHQQQYTALRHLSPTDNHLHNTIQQNLNKLSHTISVANSLSPHPHQPPCQQHLYNTINELLRQDIAWAITCLQQIIRSPYTPPNLLHNIHLDIPPSNQPAAIKTLIHSIINNTLILSDYINITRNHQGNIIITHTPLFTTLAQLLTQPMQHIAADPSAPPSHQQQARKALALFQSHQQPIPHNTHTLLQLAQDTNLHPILRRTYAQQALQQHTDTQHIITQLTQIPLQHRTIILDIIDQACHRIAQQHSTQAFHQIITDNPQLIYHLQHTQTAPSHNSHPQQPSTIIGIDNSKLITYYQQLTTQQQHNIITTLTATHHPRSYQILMTLLAHHPQQINHVPPHYINIIAAHEPHFAQHILKPHTKPHTPQHTALNSITFAPTPPHNSHTQQATHTLAAQLRHWLNQIHIYTPDTLPPHHSPPPHTPQYVNMPIESIQAAQYIQHISKQLHPSHIQTPKQYLVLNQQTPHQISIQFNPANNHIHIDNAQLYTQPITNPQRNATTQEIDQVYRLIEATGALHQQGHQLPIITGHHPQAPHHIHITNTDHHTFVYAPIINYYSRNIIPHQLSKDILQQEYDLRIQNIYIQQEIGILQRLQSCYPQQHIAPRHSKQQQPLNTQHTITHHPITLNIDISNIQHPTQHHHTH